MSTNFVSVNTDYQSRPNASYARAARGSNNNTKSFSEVLSNEAQTKTTAKANYDKESPMAVYSVCMNWLENKRMMPEKTKAAIAIKPVSIVSGYCKTAN